MVFMIHLLRFLHQTDSHFAPPFPPRRPPPCQSTSVILATFHGVGFVDAVWAATSPPAAAANLVKQLATEAKARAENEAREEARLVRGKVSHAMLSPQKTKKRKKQESFLVFILIIALLSRPLLLGL